MKAAIYARKSTDDEKEKDDPEKSVERQIANAKAFAAEKGWTVDDRFVFVDDAVSGADIRRLVEKKRMLDMIFSGSCPFGVVVTQAHDRLSRRAGDEAFGELKSMSAHVTIWFYADRAQFEHGTFATNILGVIKAEVAAEFRRAIAQKTTETMVTKAKRGYVTGSRTFGYNNVRKGSYVEREINEVERPVVLKIFEMFVAEHGLKYIAQRLTRENAPFPKPFKQKASQWPPVNGWSPSTIRTILSREIYHGEIVWNKTKKRTNDGDVKQHDRPESEWIRFQNEDLRIVPEDVWLRAVARRKEIAGRIVRSAHGRLAGGPPRHGINNVLSGLGQCALCGGGIIIETSHRKKKPRKPEYMCARRRYNGGCANALHIPVEDVNEAVFQAIEEHVLTPEAVEQFIESAEREDVAERQQQLVKERADIAKRLSRLVTSIETGDQPASVMARITQLETRVRAIDAEAATLRPVPRLPPTVVQDRLAEWRQALRGTPTQARSVLQRALRSRLRLTPLPDGKGFRFDAETRFDRLFAGVVVPRPAFIPKGDTRGTEHIGPEDTFDADYGRLLERAYERATASTAEKSMGKKHAAVVASPHGSERDGIELYRNFGG